MRLSVAMATLNEERAIPKVVGDIKRHGAPWDPEIVVVDSSTDRTAEVARGLGARVIWQPPSGHGRALLAAMRAARGDIVMTADCDDTYPMKDIPRFIRLIEEEGYDLVSANRMTRRLRAMPLGNRLANHGFALLVRLLYGIPTSDVSTGMFAVRRRVLETVRFRTNYSLPAEIIVRSNLAGFRWRQVDIEYRIRVGEVTLHRWRSGKAYLKFIFGYRLPMFREKVLSTA